MATQTCYWCNAEYPGDGCACEQILAAQREAWLDVALANDRVWDRRGELLTHDRRDMPEVTVQTNAEMEAARAELAALEAILRGTPAEQRRAFLVCLACALGAALASALLL